MLEVLLALGVISTLGTIIKHIARMDTKLQICSRNRVGSVFHNSMFEDVLYGVFSIVRGKSRIQAEKRYCICLTRRNQISNTFDGAIKLLIQ